MTGETEPYKKDPTVTWVFEVGGVVWKVQREDLEDYQTGKPITHWNEHGPPEPFPGE